MIPDTVLGHYRVLRLLGKGGMGEVYAAEDTRLHRTVALKILPAALAADPDRRKRFEREAQAVAALNHPNIVTIHSVEEAGDVLFLTMEAVEGRTLKDLMDAGALPIDTVLRVAVAMSDALAAAHQRGITHRDLKPANIMVTPDGRVKVLDFGLAKLREAERQAAAEQPTRMHSDNLTGEGRIIGTVAYMSPEQAEGKPVDQRSDIFSAGVVLHEMAVGERPFKGDTDISLISSILKDTPSSITDLRPEVPAGLARIVRRCLAKDPERRYQSGTDLRNDLEELKQDLDSGAAAQPAPMAAVRRRRGARTLAVAVAAVVIIAVGLFAWLRFGRGASSSAMTFTADRFTALTSSGSAYLAALSQDGRYVVHAKSENGRQGLWLRQTATASDTSIVPPADDRILGLTFSPDSNYVYYVTVPRGSAVASLYRVPLLGGAPIRVLENVDTAPSFSPDGHNFAFIRNEAGATRLMVAGIDGSAVRSLSVGTGNGRLRFFPQAAPAWSPDGKTILVPASKGRVSAVDVASGAVRVVSEGWAANVRSVQWMPDGRAFVIEGADTVEAVTAQQLWEVAYPSGERRRITNDVSGYEGVSLSADATLLATVKSSTQAKIWIVPAGRGEAREIGGGPGRAMGASGVCWTTDGRLVFTAISAGVSQLWIEGADGSGLRQLTMGEARLMQPAVSPDDRWVYYMHVTPGSAEIWRIGIDGSDPRQLTKGEKPVPSPDGRFVYFTTGGRLTSRTMRISVDGGEPSVVSDAPFWVNGTSPDGSELIGVSMNTAKRRLECAVLPTSGGTPRLLGDVSVAAGGRPGTCAFDSSGTAIVYLAIRDGITNLFAQPLSGGVERPLTRFGRDAFPEMFWAAMSRDGRLAVSRGTTTSDVVLIAAKQVAR